MLAFSALLALTPEATSSASAQAASVAVARRYGADFAVEFDGCGALERATRSFLELESESLNDARGAALGASVRCIDSSASIRLREVDGHRAIERDVALDASPDRARLLALAIAELVAEARVVFIPGSGIEDPSQRAANGSANRESEDESDELAAPIDSATVPAEPRKSAADIFELSALAVGELSSSPLVPRAGATLAGELELAPFLRWWLAVQGLGGVFYRSGADIVVADLSGATSLAARIELDSVWLGFELGARLGGLVVRATPRNSDLADGSERVQAYGGPLGAIHADWKIACGVALRARVEAGANLRPIVSVIAPEQRELHGFDGAWGSVGIGVLLTLL